MPEKQLRIEKVAAMRKILSEIPSPSDYTPITDALQRTIELGEGGIASTLKSLNSMPQSTMVFDNPVLNRASVHCDGGNITLNIRSFALRGVIRESEIVANQLSPASIIFTGLFGRKPKKTGDDLDEEAMLDTLINRKFYRFRRVSRESVLGIQPIIHQIAEFVRAFPESGPEEVIQNFSTLRKIHHTKHRIPDRGINEERLSGSLLIEMIATHMENVALGAMSVYMRHLLRKTPNLPAQALAQQTNRIISREQKAGKTAFQTCYSLLLGRHASGVECNILERMGAIQIHHGSAGSSMVARYLATLHTSKVSDFYIASQMTLDGDRHFGAIHDMTNFINQIEPLTPKARDEAIRKEVIGGGIPTFGHPEIAAAGRADEIQQDPRPAIYLQLLFRAIDSNDIILSDRQHKRLAIAQRIYQIAFVEGVIKPGREDAAPLRLTPNTDFGAWCVQEGLDIYETDRTLLTYVFRGFGWMMDAREQLQLKIIRPVIPAHPSIVPKPIKDDSIIPDLVVDNHNRLASGNAFIAH